VGTGTGGAATSGYPLATLRVEQFRMSKLHGALGAARPTFEQADGLGNTPLRRLLRRTEFINGLLADHEPLSLQASQPRPFATKKARPAKAAPRNFPAINYQLPQPSTNYGVGVGVVVWRAGRFRSDFFLSPMACA
jgi:hypothetical protein